MLNSNFLQLLDKQVNVIGKKLIDQTFGVLCDDTIHSFAIEIEKKLLNLGFNNTVVKRTFLVVIEGMQNIIRHGYRTNDELYGGCLVVESSGFIEIMYLNLLPNAEKAHLVAMMEEVNNCSYDVLKEKYLDNLSNSDFSDKNGAGLGIMTMRLKTGRVLNSIFEPLDSDWLGFALICSVDKNYS